MQRWIELERGRLQSLLPGPQDCDRLAVPLDAGGVVASVAAADGDTEITRAGVGIPKDEVDLNGVVRRVSHRDRR